MLWMCPGDPRRRGDAIATVVCVVVSVVMIAGTTVTPRSDLIRWVFDVETSGVGSLVAANLNFEGR